MENTNSIAKTFFGLLIGLAIALGGGFLSVIIAGALPSSMMTLRFFVFAFIVAMSFSVFTVTTGNFAVALITILVFSLFPFYLIYFEGTTPPPSAITFYWSALYLSLPIGLILAVKQEVDVRGMSVLKPFFALLKAMIWAVQKIIPIEDILAARKEKARTENSAMWDYVKNTVKNAKIHQVIYTVLDVSVSDQSYTELRSHPSRSTHYINGIPVELETTSYSTFRHEKVVMSLWARDDDGQEHHFKFVNRDYNFRPGHKMCITYVDGSIEKIDNNTTWTTYPREVYVTPESEIEGINFISAIASGIPLLNLLAAMDLKMNLGVVKLSKRTYIPDSVGKMTVNLLFLYAVTTSCIAVHDFFVDSHEMLFSYNFFSITAMVLAPAVFFGYRMINDTAVLSEIAEYARKDFERRSP